MDWYEDRTSERTLHLLLGRVHFNSANAGEESKAIYPIYPIYHSSDAIYLEISYQYHRLQCVQIVIDG